jgi:type VI secretion system protein ImpA
MASPPHLNADELLAPVPGANPAGVVVPLTTRQKLALLRKEGDPQAGEGEEGEVKKADWPGIVRLSQDTLTKTSKDLLIAACLTEALTKLHGFGGLRDSLQLLRLLVEQCWDRLYPVPDTEEGEGMEVRAGPFLWLSDVDRGARFPSTVSLLPLVKIKDERYSWQDWKRAQGGKGPIPDKEFETASPASPDVGEDLARCVDELDQLDRSLNERMGKDAPALTGLHDALESCHRLLEPILRRQQAAEAPAAAAAAAGTAPGAAGGMNGPITSRAEAYDRIARVATVLEQLEPHSPIPDLLRRAIELGKMPFRKLVQELIRDPNQLAEVKREFGLREGSEAPRSE